MKETENVLGEAEEQFTMGGSDMGGPDSLINPRQRDTASEQEIENLTDSGMGLVGEMGVVPESDQTCSA